MNTGGRYTTLGDVQLMSTALPLHFIAAFPPRIEREQPAGIQKAKALPGFSARPPEYERGQGEEPGKGSCSRHNIVTSLVSTIHYATLQSLTRLTPPSPHPATVLLSIIRPTAAPPSLISQIAPFLSRPSALLLPTARLTTVPRPLNPLPSRLRPWAQPLALSLRPSLPPRHPPRSLSSPTKYYQGNRGEICQTRPHVLARRNPAGVVHAHVITVAGGAPYLFMTRPTRGYGRVTSAPPSRFLLGFASLM
ncbi:hypothetical protein BOTBODRAFT_372128 [Botryobasidium botryosum FD-172 SS1]|uniref:Uncharacterized protein n=1 Tax=Botryobasidium botryosum (strain FD-172 SS1) TaxID=930990 RepID=A0A067MCJ4_BOTB1|nr:hypothetical protein BOTBODRAFT_372128 [Botryobasidium botryosum FD-172 SS1]